MQSQFTYSPTLKASRLNPTVALLLAITLLMGSGSAWAQGTASGPYTSHVVDPTTPDEIWIGGINDPLYGPDPFPIDLDPTGAPWTKDVLEDPTGIVVTGVVTLHETIQNVGTEPWTDWHEISYSGSTVGADWDSVLDLRVNGSSISYTASISGAMLTLDNFSQPVLPGDVFEIDKTMVLTGTSAGTSGLLFRIAEFPTTKVPEPTGVALAACGLLLTTRRRRHR